MSDFQNDNSTLDDVPLSKSDIRQALTKYLAESFSIRELKQLIFDLGETCDDFDKGTMDSFSIDVIGYFERIKELPKFLKAALKKRPDLGIDQILTRLTTNSTSTKTSTNVNIPNSPTVPTIPAETPHNLPTPLNRLLGRDAYLLDVSQHLTRVTVLWGPGGVGKTHFAIELGHRLLNRFPQGVWFVALEELTEPALLESTIAQTIGIKEEKEQALSKTLIAYFKNKQSLLILDNCEHLLKAITNLVKRLCEACPTLHILGTSREKSIIMGETTFEIPSLEFPKPAVLAGPENLNQYGATQLFVERATALTRVFEVTTQNSTVIAKICRQLDGIPLAIELVAAYTSTFPPEEIVKRLDAYLEPLASGNATGNIERHQTLKATFDWSYDLLSLQEQLFFEHLAIFASSWSLEAIKAICTGKYVNISIRDHDVISLLQNLVNKSLLTVEKHDNANRYRFLETIKQYAMEKLKLRKVDKAKLEVKYATYYLTLAETIEPKLLDSQQKEALSILDAENNNFRAVFAWVLEKNSNQKERLAIGLRLGSALLRFWTAQGYLSEGRNLLEDVLLKFRTYSKRESLASIEWQQKLMKLLNSLGVLTSMQGIFDKAKQYWEEALLIARQLQDKSSIARSLNDLSIVAASQEDFILARTLDEESLAIYKELGDQNHEAYVLNNLGLIARFQGDYAAAHIFLEEGLKYHNKIGNEINIAFVLKSQADVFIDEGDYNIAHDKLQEALVLDHKLMYQEGIAAGFEFFAGLAALKGKNEAALILVSAATKLREELGVPLLRVEQAILNKRLQIARQVLNETQTKLASETGEQMTIKEAIDYIATINFK
jgi:predicted ATPase